MPPRRRWSEGSGRSSTHTGGTYRPRSAGSGHAGARRADRSALADVDQPPQAADVVDVPDMPTDDPPQPTPEPVPANPTAGVVTQAEPIPSATAPVVTAPAAPLPVPAVVTSADAPPISGPVSGSPSEMGIPSDRPATDRFATGGAGVGGGGGVGERPRFDHVRPGARPEMQDRGHRHDGYRSQSGHGVVPSHQIQPPGMPGAASSMGSSWGAGAPGQGVSGQVEVRPVEYREILKQDRSAIQRLCKEYGLRPDSKLRKEHVAYLVYKAMAEAQNRNVHLSFGTLEILPDGYGFLRTRTYIIDETDVYVSPSQIKRFGLRTGDQVIGQVRTPKENESYHALLRVEAVNFIEPELAKNRPHFDELIPLYPSERYLLETDPDKISARLVDLVTPVGRGQRGLIVAPPKAGKTTLIKDIANAITHNHPDAYVMILLIDERPEEVTDMQRSVSAEVASSTFDEPIANHLRVSEMILEKAKRLVEQGEHVVILMDSLTRLARAYNISVPSSGQTLSGGVNPHALQKPKRFFGSARAVEFGGSLTCIATALIDTGNKMDDFIFEEFKGTGNMELHLDRELFNKRIFPSVDVKNSGTRKEELLIGDDAVKKMHVLRRVLASVSPQEALELLLKHIKKAKTNADFLGALNQAELMEA